MRSERIEMYTKKMKEINFMADYMSDIPEIFDTKTIKCKLFLAKIFTVLYPNFHYLSFLSEGEIDKELMKVASILHIYSNDPHQINESLSNINESKAHIFWIRLFNLCKICSGCINSNSVLKESYNNKLYHNKFSNIKKTLQHKNYNIATINSSTEVDINQEINTWTKEAPLPVAKSESSLNIVSPSEIKENDLPDINNLISTINYIGKKIDCKSQDLLKENCYPYEDFFIDFNQTVKEISLFKKNLNFISSFIVPKIINTKTLYNGIDWSLYKYQIKRCNKIIEDITLKAKNCNSSSLNIKF